MEKFKAPISFRIIYVLNEVIFWLISLVSVLAVVFVILVFAGVFKEDMQLHVNLPVAFNTQEIGYLTANSVASSVQLVEAYGSIHLIDTPLHLSRPFMFPLLFVVGSMFFALYTFRKFIRNVRNGIIFESGNIKYLRILSITMLGFWLFWQTYCWVVGWWFEKRLNFGTIEITREIQNQNGFLLASLILWVLSHIFIKGIQLQEDQSLTI